jgi:large subunit ribosomal protein L35
MKTKKSAAKRFTVTGSGKIKFASAKRRHGLSKRPQKMKSQSRGVRMMHPSDAARVQKYFLG